MKTESRQTTLTPASWSPAKVEELVHGVTKKEATRKKQKEAEHSRGIYFRWSPGGKVVGPKHICAERGCHSVRESHASLAPKWPKRRTQFLVPAQQAHAELKLAYGEPVNAGYLQLMLWRTHYLYQYPDGEEKGNTDGGDSGITAELGAMVKEWPQDKGNNNKR